MESIILIVLFLIVNLSLMGLTILFYFSTKKNNSTPKLKIEIIILIIVSMSLYIYSSRINFASSVQDQVNYGEIIAINLIFLLFCFSTTTFYLSLYDSDEDIVSLKYPSFFKSRKGKIKIGKSMERKRSKYNFFLSLKDLEKHMFVCGATGTGKSNFIQNFLIKFSKRHKIPFLLVEFKGEYHFLQNKIENLLIIRPGENFSLNIFNPEGTNPAIHAERIFDILKSGRFLDESAEFSPQMQKVLVEVLAHVCRNKEYQSWKGFYKICEMYANKFEKEIPMLSQTLISIKNRIRRFSLGSLKALFEIDHQIKIKDLFSRNILIDLSSIIRLGGEKSDTLFFLNMILKYLWDKNITRGAYNFKGIKHITIVEDAQYFAPKDLARQTKLSSYLEDIALLQRGTGECLISIATHPAISEEILANCGALIVFKTHMQREFLCELLNLDKDKQDYMSILEEGQCIARINSIKRPFLLSVPYIEREYLNLSEINYNNSRVLNSHMKEVKNKKMRIYETIFNFYNVIKNKMISFYNNALSFMRNKIEKVVELHKIRKEEKKLNNKFIIEEEIEFINNDFKEKEENFQDLDVELEDLRKSIEELYIKQQQSEGEIH